MMWHLLFTVDRWPGSIMFETGAKNYRQLLNTWALLGAMQLCILKHSGRTPCRRWWKQWDGGNRGEQKIIFSMFPTCGSSSRFRQTRTNFVRFCFVLTPFSGTLPDDNSALCKSCKCATFTLSSMSLEASWSISPFLCNVVKSCGLWSGTASNAHNKSDFEDIDAIAKQRFPCTCWGYLIISPATDCPILLPSIISLGTWGYHE